MKAVGLRRERSLSPGVHATTDTALLDAILAELARAGWRTDVLAEEDVPARATLPDADLFLNMCQGRASNERLLELERSGRRIVNKPSVSLGCHRDALVTTMLHAGLPFVSSTIVRRGETPDIDGSEFWVKRGDVHAQTAEDVVRVPRSGVAGAVERLFARGIEAAVIQPHLEGRLVKFYGIGSGEFFRAFEPEGKEIADAMLEDIAFTAATAIGLEVFGGDAVISDSAVLIDVNDFPSMARYRDDAAAAIARYVMRR